ncbi:MAG: hypothetical protein ACP5R4_06865, partial [Armatimonadota bacterium]
REREWNVPLRTLVQLRREYTWSDLEQGMNLARKHNRTLQDVLQIKRKEGLSWGEVDQRLTRLEAVR